MFREKFKRVINLCHYTHTPLVVLRNQLEEIVVGNLPESAVTKLQPVSYTHLILLIEIGEVWFFIFLIDVDT